ncbi:hypothetical protein OUZ56_006846 [Daphnia magna]|uniref:TIMELESS/TIM-1 protein n=1 Tax=Daphnia magna TaxID=35525 RepID=A0ABQ9YY48_9CRUS|nr:hypothetical protein OUZ56_006846 [Daphnia magna]
MIEFQISVCLEDLIRQLNCDDTKTHSRRRGLGYIDLLNKDLKPILISSYRNWPKVFRSTVKLSVAITTPIESLVCDRTRDQKTYSSYVTYELKQLLYKAKEAFLDLSATRAIIEHSKLLLAKQPSSRDEIELLNLCLLLIRNILDAPERPVEPDSQMSPYSQSYNIELSQQNEIVCNIFAQGFGKLLLDMLACPQKGQLVVTIVQVIAAIYKDWSVENIQEKLNIMFESSVNVSFDDDEKNNPTSPLEPLCHTLQEALTVMSSTSSSSASYGDEQKMTKKQRQKTSTLKLCSTLRENVSNEDAISQLLGKFTIDFMLNGFSVLLNELLQQLKQKDNHLVDKSHFLWLLVNFLPFTSQLGQKPNILKQVLTTDLMGYLIWVVVQETENVQLDSINTAIDPKPSLRRLRLGVRAIFEYLQALEKYSVIRVSDTDKNSFSQCSEQWIFQLRHDLLAMAELRQLFLLLLRHFNNEFQTHQFLGDIICANHALLLTLERAVQQSEYKASFDLDHHLKQFCISTIMARYGSALEDFKTNDYFVNESIFTMLRRVGCEFGRFDLLCQPIILRPLCKIWEEEFEICDDWHDLIERLMRKFTENLLDDCEKVSPHKSKQRPPDIESFQFLESDQQPLDALAEEFTSKHDPLTETYGDIKLLIHQLTSAGFNKQLGWIQSSLLTACATRLHSYSGREFNHPICCSCATMKIPCPIVPWTEMEASGLRSEHFRFLLQLMGLIPQFSQYFFYPKIPTEWSADVLFSYALLFGPIPDYVDFDLTLVKKVNLPIVPDF